MADAFCCQMCPNAAHFLNFLGLSPNNTHDLIVNFVHFNFPGRCGGGGRHLILDHPQGLCARTCIAKKCSPDLMQCNSRAWPQKNEGMHPSNRPEFHLFLRWRHSYGLQEARPPSWRNAYEKKTNVLCGRSVEIRAPVFITLVYRLNSHLPPLPSVLNVPLICSLCACT